MTRHRSCWVLGLALLPFLRIETIAGAANAPREAESAAAHPSAPPRVGQGFERNQGQVGRDFAFVARLDGYEALLDPTGTVLRLPSLAGSVADRQETRETGPDSVRLSYLGALLPRIVGIDPLPGKVHYLIGGDPQSWLTDIPTFAGVEYVELYPGVTLDIRGDLRDLEHRFVVAPGADPAAIRLGIEGAERLHADTEAGELVLEIAGSQVLALATRAYQEGDGGISDVPAVYALSGSEVGLRVSKYDVEKPLVLRFALRRFTPTDLADFGEAVHLAVDSVGSVYVAGRALTGFDEPAEAFVSKLDADGSTTLYKTYLGGEGADVPSGITVAPGGEVVLTGWTTSTTFPAMGAIKEHLAGSTDAFVARLSADGSRLLYSTYLGGASEDEGRAIATDAEGSVWVTGLARGGGFPTTDTALQREAGGMSEAFLARLSPDGSKLLYASYLGGSDDDEGTAVRLDGRGNVHVAGTTRSADFPVARAWQPALSGAGTTDAFVATLNPNGDRLLYSTYLGGTGDDAATSLDVDSSGNVFVAGRSTSPDFPVTVGAVQAILGGEGVHALGDAFVAKLDSDGASLSYATYLGGACDDEAGGIAVDATGNAWIAGTTCSLDFAGSPASPQRLSGRSDAFVAEVDAKGEVLLRSIFFGGAKDDAGSGIALMPAGGAVLAGLARSTEQTSILPVQPASSGGLVFVSRVPESDAAPRAAGCPGTINFDNGAGTGLWETATNWDTNSLPGPTDDVCINGFNVTLSLFSTQTINSVTVSATGSLTLASGSLSIVAPSQIDGPFNLTGGTLTGPGTLTVSGLLTWTGGTMTGGGITNANGGISISGAVTKDLNPRTLNNTGTATWTGTGGLRVSNGGVINNTGTWDAQGDTTISNLFGGAATFTNGGTFKKSAGTGTTTVSIPFNSSSSVDVQTGTINLSSGGTHSGAFTGSGGATLQFGLGTHDLSGTSSVNVPNVVCSGGTVNVNGTYSATSGTTASGATVNFNASSTVSSIGVALTISGGAVNFNSGDPINPTTLSQSGGTLGGTDTVTVSGLTTWTGGFMTDAGTTNANGGLSLSGGGTKDLTSSRVLNTAGTTTWTGTVGMRLASGAVINNTGIWDCQSDAALSDLSGTTTFNNNAPGIFRKSAGAGTTTVGITFNNASTLDIQSGTIILNGGGTHGGSFTGSPGTTLRFGGGTHALQAASSVNASTVVFSGGTVNVDGAYSATGGTTASGATINFNASSTVSSIGVALTISGGAVNFNSGDPINPTTLSHSGGTLAGTDTVTVSGLSTWTGGFMTGPGTTNANGGLSLSGAGFVDLTSSRVLNAAGTTTWTGTVGVRLASGAVINNTGIWDCQSDAALSDLSGTTTFNNNAPGIFRKSAGAGTTTVGITFNNASTLDIQSGTIILNGGGTHGGSFTGSPGTTLRFGGGTHALQAASSVNAPTVVFSGGTVNVDGAYSATGGTTTSGATVNFNASSTVSGIGVALTVSAGAVNFNSGDPINTTTFSHSGGTLAGTDTVTVSGLSTWTGGFMTGAGTTNANGGLSLSGAGFVDLTSSRVLNTAGTTTWTGTVGLRGASGAVINNTGTWDCQSDAAISLQSGTATFNNNAPGIFRKSAGAGTTTVGITFNNASTLDIQSETITLNGGSTHSGSVTGSPGTTLRFGGGTHALQAASSVNASTVVFSGGTVNVDGAYGAASGTTVSGTVNFNASSTVSSIGVALTVSAGAVNFNSGDPINPTTLSQSGGTLAGTDTVTVSGLTTWTGGFMTGAGTTNANGGLSLSGAGFVDLTSSRVLNTAGTTTWTGTVGLRGASGAVINNTGTWDCQSDAAISDLSGTTTFHNNAPGIFRKSAGAGTTTVSVPFTTSGAVEAFSGTLSFTNGYPQTAGSTTQNGGVVTSPTPLNIQGGVLRGIGTVAAGVSSAGQTGPGLSPGILGISGSYTQASAGSFAAEVGGLTAGTEHDRLDVASVATLAGTLQVTLVNGFVPSAGNEFTILTCGSRSETFATTSFPSLPPGLQWRIDYFDTAVKLVVLSVPAGRVPGDLASESPVTAAKSGSNLTLTWAGTCVPTDTDFAVYEGVLGSFTSHVPVLCSTGGATTATFAPAAGNRYYLVVAHNGGEEGSYGYGSNGAERAASPTACHPRNIASCP